jgi:hypothetical protein
MVLRIAEEVEELMRPSPHRSSVPPGGVAKTIATPLLLLRCYP